MSAPVGVAPSGIITLLTDFGLEDPFVGVMKGVMAQVAPAARYVDLTHSISPQDVTAAAFWLTRVAPYFPSGTVHLVVVDPTVGTARKALAARVADQYFVGPDNGVLGLPPVPADGVSVVELSAAKASATFHGRDVFAPAAARLAAGTPLDALGPRVQQWVESAVTAPQGTGDVIVGQVVVVDHYGNLITNIELPERAEVREVRCQGRTPRWGRTYADVAAGDLVALVDSWGLVELAVRGGSAAKRLGVGPGARVEVELSPNSAR